MYIYMDVIAHQYDKVGYLGVVSVAIIPKSSTQGELQIESMPFHGHHFLTIISKIKLKI